MNQTFSGKTKCEEPITKQNMCGATLSKPR